MIGEIIAISDINIKVFIKDTNKVRLNDILFVIKDSKEFRMEVAEIDSKIITCIPFESVIGLSKGLKVYRKFNGLEMEYSDAVLGRTFNSYGDVLAGGIIKEKQKA